MNFMLHLDGGREAVAGIAAVLGAGFLAAGLWGMLVLVQVVAPAITGRCVRTLTRRRLLSFGVGLPIAAILFVAGAFLGKHPVPSVVWLAVAAPIALVGAGASAEEVGRRVLEVSGREGTRLRHLTLGWVVFVLSSLVPVAGWFVVFPYLLVSGVGAILVPPRAEPLPRNPPRPPA